MRELAHPGDTVRMPWASTEIPQETVVPPAIDSVQRMFWVCAPVGIAPEHLPRQCRGG